VANVRDSRSFRVSNPGFNSRARQVWLRLPSFWGHWNEQQLVKSGWLLWKIANVNHRSGRVLATRPRHCENSFQLWVHGNETDISTAPQIWVLLMIGSEFTLHLSFNLEIMKEPISAKTFTLLQLYNEYLWNYIEILSWSYLTHHIGIPIYKSVIYCRLLLWFMNCERSSRLL